MCFKNVTVMSSNSLYIIKETCTTKLQLEEVFLIV